jgi:hypothetical protein
MLVEGSPIETACADRPSPLHPLAGAGACGLLLGREDARAGNRHEARMRRAKLWWASRSVMILLMSA